MATRIGFYTGRLYDSSVDLDTIKECCEVLNYKEPVLENEELVIEKRKQLRKNCIGCFGCEESKMNLELITKWKSIYVNGDVCMAHLLISKEAEELSPNQKEELLEWAGESEENN